MEIGVHGLYVRTPHGVGLLLPQVATNRGWDAQDFLGMTCVKAGLDRDEWRTNDSLERFTFSAEVFEELSFE